MEINLHNNESVNVDVKPKRTTRKTTTAKKTSSKKTTASKSKKTTKA